VVFGKFVISGGDVAEMFDLAEESLDRIIHLIEMSAEADGVLSVSFGPVSLPVPAR